MKRVRCRCEGWVHTSHTRAASLWHGIATQWVLLDGRERNSASTEGGRFQFLQKIHFCLGLVAAQGGVSFFLSCEGWRGVTPPPTTTTTTTTKWSRGRVPPSAAPRHRPPNSRWLPLGRGVWWGRAVGGNGILDIVQQASEHAEANFFQQKLEMFTDHLLALLIWVENLNFFCVFFVQTFHLVVCARKSQDASICVVFARSVIIPRQHCNTPSQVRAQFAMTKTAKSHCFS